MKTWEEIETWPVVDGWHVGPNGYQVRIGAWAKIGERAEIGAWAKIGERAVIGAWAVIGAGAKIGERATRAWFLGYEPQRRFARTLYLAKGKLRFSAGCRDYSIQEARAHWGSPDYPDRARGDAYLRLLDFAEAEAVATGWFKKGGK